MKVDNRKNPKAGEVYRHFKGNLYEVLGIAAHTETSEKLVVYRDCNNAERVFARPLDMFMSKVDHIKYPFVRAKYRFTLEAEAVEVEYVVEEVIAEENEGSEEEAAAEVLADEVEETEVVEEAPVEEEVVSAPVEQAEEVAEETSEEVVEEITEPVTDEKAENVSEEKSEDEVPALDPIVEKILDAKEYTEKIEYFELLRNRCDDSMLATLAMAMDIQLEEDTLEGKYAQILKTFKMHEKYETSRLRF